MTDKEYKELREKLRLEEIRRDKINEYKYDLEDLSDERIKKALCQNPFEGINHIKLIISKELDAAGDGNHGTYTKTYEFSFKNKDLVEKMLELYREELKKELTKLEEAE